MAEDHVEIVTFSMPEAVRSLPVPSLHSRATAPSCARTVSPVLSTSNTKHELPHNIPNWPRAPPPHAHPMDPHELNAERGNGSAPPSQLPSSRHPSHLKAPREKFCTHSCCRSRVASLPPPRVGPAPGAAVHRALRPRRWAVGHSRRALLRPSPGAPALWGLSPREACSSLISMPSQFSHSLHRAPCCPRPASLSCSTCTPSRPAPRTRGTARTAGTWTSGCAPCASRSPPRQGGHT